MHSLYGYFCNNLRNEKNLDLLSTLIAAISYLETEYIFIFQKLHSRQKSSIQGWCKRYSFNPNSLGVCHISLPCFKGKLPRKTWRSKRFRLENHLLSFSSQRCPFKGCVSRDFWVLFWHVWIDLGLYKNLWLFINFSVEPLMLYICLRFRQG
jgi:hypothetical protein